MALQLSAKLLGPVKYFHPALLSRNCQVRYKSLLANFQKLKATQRANEEKLVEKIQTTKHKEVIVEDIKNDDEVVNATPQIHRRFPKSSTQNAVTSCLKPSRLASPFPEPVKMMLSNETVSDEEKSRRMEEEVKLEARYVLQQQQEKLLQENLRRKSNASENANGLEDLLHKKNQPCVEKEANSEYKDELEDMYYNSSKKTYSAKPENNHRSSRKHKIKSKQIQMEETERSHKKTQETEEPAKVEIKKGRRGRCKPRSSRLLRSKNTVASNQSRKYSMYTRNAQLTEPELLSPSTQIDTILHQLKMLDPKYKQIKKPLFFPGSEDEKKFYRMILKLLSEHKQESKRLSAPYPSYSEVKTYACEGKAKVYEPALSKNNIEPLWGKCNTRSYSTYVTRLPPLQIFARDNTPMLGKRELGYYNSSGARFRSVFDTKSKYYNRTVMQTITQGLVAKIQSCKESMKKFSTSTFMRKDERKSEKMEMREKPPCQNPYPNIPVCDYEEVARLNKFNRKTRGRKPCVDGCPPACNQYPCDPHCNPCYPCYPSYPCYPCNPCNPCNPPCNPCNPCNPCRKCSTMPVISTTNGDDENQHVVNRIKEWLSTWKPESNHIKISKCTTDDDTDDRETYVIEITDCDDANIKDEQLKGELLHIPNMDRHAIYVDPTNIPLEFSETDKIIIQNVPGYMSIEALTSKDLDTVMLSSAMLGTMDNSTRTQSIDVAPVANYTEDVKLMQDDTKKMNNTFTNLRGTPNFSNTSNLSNAANMDTTNLNTSNLNNFNTSNLNTSNTSNINTFQASNLNTSDTSNLNSSNTSNLNTSNTSNLHTTNLENEPGAKQKTEPANMNNVVLEETKQQVPLTNSNNLETKQEEIKPIQKKMVAEINNLLEENKPAAVQKKMVSDINDILEENKPPIQKKMLDINSILDEKKPKQMKIVPELNNMLDDKKQTSQNNKPNLNSIMRETENFYFDDTKRTNENSKISEKKKDLRLSDKIVEQVKVFKPIDSYVDYDSNVLTRQDNKYIKKPKNEPFKLKTEFWRK